MPVVLLESQFELLMGVFAFAIGPPAALGLVRPTSLAALLSETLVRGYGIALTIAGLAIIVGLRHGHPRWPCASGLNLLGVATLAYAVAIFGAIGIGGIASGAIFIAVSILCWLRAFTITTSNREREAIALQVVQE